jgi:ligand-binding sensor domain-containing protein
MRRFSVRFKVMYRYYFNKIILILLLFCISSIMLGQNEGRIHDQCRFRSLSIDQGLSNGRVISIEQDDFGIIWFGTVNGLNRYDGYDLINYFHIENDSTSLPDNRIEEIFCDSRGDLWIGTTGGLCKYNYGLNNFIQFQHDSLTVSIDGVNDITEDKTGGLWMATSSGLIYFNPANDNIKVYSNDPNDPASLPNDNLTNVLIDSDGKIWTTMYREGIAVLDPTDGNLSNYVNDPFDSTSLNDNRIETMYLDSNGEIWLGAYDNGLNRFDEQSNSFLRYYPDRTITGSGRIRAIFEDNSNNFWIGTQTGLFSFNRASGKFYRYAYADHPFSTLSHNSIQCALIDNQEGLWLGTFAGGVDYTNLNASGFTLYEFSHLRNPYFINDKNVYCFAEDRNGDLWIGTEHGGINHLSRNTGIFRYIVPNPGSKNTLLSDNIKEIVVDNHDNLWVGTNRGGLTYYNVANEKMTNYTHDPDDPYSILHNDIYAICLDTRDILWIGTREGICMKPAGENIFIPKEVNGIEGISSDIGYIEKIVEDHNGGIWMSSPGLSGIIHSEPMSESLLFINKIDTFEIEGINDLQIDNNGSLWMGFENGNLLRLNTDTRESRLYTQKDGLPLISIVGILDDPKGNIWISSNNGIYCILDLTNEPDSIEIKHYDKSNGLQSKQFILNSKMKSREGELFFGGISGFNSFFPEKVVENPYPPSVIFTNLRVNNNMVIVGEELYGRVILEEALAETREMTLHHKIKIFTIEFAGLHYMAPEKNQYAYIMEGYDEWTYVDASRRFATYSNLPPGKYVFKVKASNNSGKWVDEPISLAIRIKPPFWRTVWFFLIVGAVIILLVIVFIRWREQQLKHDKLALETKIKEGQDELNEKKSEVEKQQKILEEKEQSEKEIRFFNSGLAVFSEILSKEKEDVALLSQHIISKLVEYIEANIGGIYILNDIDKDNPVLELTGSYAYEKEIKAKKNLLTEEGQVGACYRSKETVIMKELPDDYMKIKSGLGEVNPRFLALIPIKLDTEILGVIELASFHVIEKYKINFIEKLSENIFSVIANIRANKIVKEMYQQTQMQAEELQSQEEEMRQNMEEMLATQEETTRKEELLQDEIKKLKTELATLKSKKK